MLKKIMALLLTLVMVLCLLPMTAFAGSTVQYEPITIDVESLNGNAVWGDGEEFSKENTTVRLDDTAAFYVDDRATDWNDGFPRDGVLKVNSGVPYTLAAGDDPSKAYYGNDCIRLYAEHTEQEMALQTIGAYDKIYVLATAGGPGTGFYAKFNVKLTYTDGTNDPTEYRLYDWFDSTTVANVEQYPNFKRANIDQYGTVTNHGSTTGGPILFSATIGADKSKLLKSITFTLTGKGQTNGEEGSIVSGLYCGVFAVTGATPANAPGKPTATVATGINQGENPCFTANWNAVGGAAGYRLDVSTDKKFTSFVGGYNNFEIPTDKITNFNTAETALSYKVTNGLALDTTYYYRIRAVNASGSSLSSNRINIGLPAWLKKAGLTLEDVDYDLETGTISLKKAVTLTDTILLPTDETNFVFNLGAYTLKAASGKAAVKASGADVKLAINGSANGTIAGGDGADSGDGQPAIDFSGVSGESSIKINQASISGGVGGSAAASAQNGAGGNGGDAIVGNASVTVTTEGTVTINGGAGGSANGTGSGGAGGNGIGGANVEIIAGDGTSATSISGGNGGDAVNGTAGAGGVGAKADSVYVNASSSVSGGKGGNATGTTGTGGNGGTGATGTTITNTGTGTINGGDGGNTAGTTAGAGGGATSGTSTTGAEDGKPGTAHATYYTVVYDRNNGIGDMSNSVVTNTSFTLPACTFTAPTGYHFKHWTVGSAESGTTVAAKGIYSLLETTTTMYAIWEKDTVAVVFNNITANGVSNVTDTTTLTLTFDKDVEGLTAADLTVDGATKGVLTKESATGVYTLAISDITVANDGMVEVAVAKEGFSFTSTSRSVTVYKCALYPVTLTLQLDDAPYTGQTIALHREGHLYPLTEGVSGAYSEDLPNGVYTIYKDGFSTGEAITVKSADASATLNYYTVTFDAKGGTPAPAQQVLLKDKMVGSPTSMSNSTNNFGGWFSDPDFENAWRFNTDKVTKSTILYAKWTPTPGIPGDPIDSTATTTQGTVAVASGSATVGASKLNVRLNAGTQYEIIGKLTRGEKVEILSIEKEWVKIVYKGVKNNDVGYVHIEYLDELTIGSVAYTGKVSCRKLNVRQAPTTAGALVAQLTRDTAVTFDTIENGWGRLAATHGELAGKWVCVKYIA